MAHRHHRWGGSRASRSPRKGEHPAQRTHHARVDPPVQCHRTGYRRPERTAPSAALLRRSRCVGRTRRNDATSDAAPLRDGRRPRRSGDLPPRSSHVRRYDGADRRRARCALSAPDQSITAGSDVHPCRVVDDRLLLRVLRADPRTRPGIARADRDPSVRRSPSDQPARCRMVATAIQK